MAVATPVVIAGPSGRRLYGGRFGPGQLSGSVSLDVLQASGVMQSASESRMSGSLTLLGLAASGGGSSLAPTVMSGALTLGQLAAGGSMTSSVPSGSTITTFKVASPLVQSNAPFAFGHAFRQGDVPTGSYAASDLVDWQCVPLSFWPDGSVKHASIAGRTNTPGADVTVTIFTGPAPVGSNLTETDLSAALPATTIAAGGFSWNLNASIGTADRTRTVCQGPVMSQFIYRKPVTGSSHLVLWAEVRIFKGGQVEIFPWIENAYLRVAGPTNDVRTYTVTIGGVQRFSQSIDVKHHTRIPLLSGSSFSYWSGTDPQITPKHDSAYLRATKLVPNYGFTSPSNTVLNALTQTYTPNTTGGIATMTLSGTSAAILGHTNNMSDPLYITSGGDPRAYRGMMVFALAGGSWHAHYRDELTNEPFTLTAAATLGINSPNNVPAGTGGENGALGATGSWTSHTPNFGYLAWLTTARWWFLDETFFWNGVMFLYQPTGSRENASGIFRSDGGATTDRGAAWGVRQVAQCVAACPTTHPCYADRIASFEANIDHYYQTVITGTKDAGNWVNNLGLFPYYGTRLQPVYGNWPGTFDIAGWMQMMLVQVFGYASDLGIPQSGTSLTKHIAVRNHGYKLAVGLAGAGDPAEWDYRWFGPYELPSGITGTRFFTDWNEAFDYMRSTFSLATPTGNALLRALTATAWADPVYIGSYFGQHVTALSYAAEHGAPGAALGHSRVINATNWTSYASNFNDQPIYGVMPRSVPPSIPAWMNGQEINAWRELLNTKLSDQPILPPPNGSGAPQGKQDAWVGFHKDVVLSKIKARGGGGHDDYWGNEVDEIDMLAAVPQWARLIGPTPSGSVTTSQEYYADGRPASVHSYYSSIYHQGLRRALMFPGAARSKDGGATGTITAWNDATNSYDPASSWAGSNAPVAVGTGNGAYAKHPVTEQVFGWLTNSAIVRWNPGVPGSWTTLIANPPNPAAFYTAGDVDPTRGTGGAGIVFWLGGGLGGNVCHRYDIGNNTLTRITLTGVDISTFSGIALQYVAALDRFIACTPSGGGSSVYVITPNSTTTWSCALLATTGGAALPATNTNSAYYPFTKFLYLPRLGGCVFGPRWGSNLWFLRLHAV